MLIESNHIIKVSAKDNGLFEDIYFNTSSQVKRAEIWEPDYRLDGESPLEKY